MATHPRAVSIFIAACLLALGAPAGARIVVPAPTQERDPGAVLSRIEEAILAGDHQTLADLVSDDGVRLCLGPLPDRTSVLIPSQAFYYFKSLFQERQTSEFFFEKRQEVDGDRVHAVAVWRFSVADAGRETRQRVLFTLIHGSNGWRVAEITAWR